MTQPEYLGTAEQRNHYIATLADHITFESKQRLFNQHHLFFQGDQKESYIRLMLENMDEKYAV